MSTNKYRVSGRPRRAIVTSMMTLLIGTAMFGLPGAAQPTLPDMFGVIQHFFERPYYFEDKAFPDKGDILWIKCDVTQDGRDDMVITGSILLTGDWRWLSWDVYKGEADGGFRQLMWGMTFDPVDVLVVKDNKNISRLATIRPFSMNEQVVTALELENDSTISSEGFRTLSSESTEDQAWVEAQRNNASGKVQIVKAEELARKYPVKATKIGKPNIIYILADDLGYGDLSCLNPESKIPTPSMDMLAAEGMTFTDAHSGSAVCTPTRYGLLTGRYAWRTRLKEHVLWGYSPPLVDHDELTAAQYLKDQGYHTACIGKWHLGLGWQTTDGTKLGDTSDLTGENIDFTKPYTHGPLNLGFDYFFGIAASLDMPPYVYLEQDRATAIPAAMKPTTFRAGLTAEGFEPVKVLPDLADRAMAYLKERHATQPEQPFFLYLPLTSPHTPVVPEPWAKGISQAGDYGDFVAQTDRVVGQVLDALDDLNLRKNTLVIVTSDNGSTEPTESMVASYGHRPNHHFRGRKSDAWEGGHRVPFIVRWPAQVSAGATSAETICHTDLLATVADMLDVPLPTGAAQDSVSLLPTLLGEKRDKPLRDFTVHHSIDGTFALRQGPWKLIDGPGSGGWSSQGTNAPGPGAPPTQLYNLDDDIGETKNLSEVMPEMVAKLRTLLEACKQAP